MESNQIVILAIIATSLATFISRFMGAITSKKVSVKSKLFQWFNCVASKPMLFSMIKKANKVIIC